MVRLQAGPLACEVEPSLGGGIAGLWHDDTPVLRSARVPLAVEVERLA